MKRIVLFISLSLMVGCSAAQQATLQQVEQDFVKIDKKIISDLCKAK